MADYRKGDTASWNAEQVRQETRPPARRRRRRKRRNPLLMLVLYVLFVGTVSAAAAGVGWLLASDLCAFHGGAPIETASVQVTAEDTVATIAQKLNEAGLIRYRWFFRIFAKITSAEEKIGIGTYELNTDMDYHALIAGMRSSSGNMTLETVTVTIPEGYTVMQTIRLLAEKGVNTEANLLEAARTANFDYDFIDNGSQEASRLEGYLFPDTYQFYVGHNPKSALERLLRNFDQKMNDDVMNQVEESEYSLKQIITIASLIEKETDGSDQSYIASVIYNRLKDTGAHGTYGMLQIDAALLYALTDHEGAITSADLETDSPYNLRKHAGLPPTPIANPGMAAINAALYPASSSYYFYALGTDKLHHYFENYNDHLNFVNSSQYGG